MHKNEDNINNDLREICYEQVDSIQMRQYIVQGSKQTGNFLTS
jgi:hypothetical protein